MAEIMKNLSLLVLFAWASEICFSIMGFYIEAMDLFVAKINYIRVCGCFSTMVFDAFCTIYQSVGIL
jgi:hypothetical protein